MFVDERRVVRRDMDVEHADVFVLEDLVMTGFLADLDLGAAGDGSGGEKGDEKDRVAHDAS